MGFIRLSRQAAVVKVAPTFRDVFGLLNENIPAPDQDYAIRRSGKLATFNSRVRALLPANQAHQRVIEVIDK